MTLATVNILINAAAVILIFYAITMDRKTHSKIMDIFDKKEEEFDELADKVKELEIKMEKIRDSLSSLVSDLSD